MVESFEDPVSLTVSHSLNWHYLDIQSISPGSSKKVIGPYAHKELRVHFQNNYPFVTLTNVVREVEVSHWGHISFEEHIDLAHTGAQLKVRHFCACHQLDLTSIFK